MAATKSNPTRDEMETPRALYHWISSNFRSQAADVVDLTRQIRDFHRGKDDPMAGFSSRLAAPHGRAQETAREDFPKLFDLLFNSVAICALGSAQSRASDWLTSRVDTPFPDLVVEASLADTTMAAIHTAARGKVEIRCTFCRRRGHLEIDCRAKVASTNGKEMFENKGKETVHAARDQAQSSFETGISSAPLALLSSSATWAPYST
jgi:hypothetical protein